MPHVHMRGAPVCSFPPSVDLSPHCFCTPPCIWPLVSLEQCSTVQHHILHLASANTPPPPPTNFLRARAAVASSCLPTTVPQLHAMASSLAPLLFAQLLLTPPCYLAPLYTISTCSYFNAFGCNLAKLITRKQQHRHVCKTWEVQGKTAAGAVGAARGPRQHKRGLGAARAEATEYRTWNEQAA